MTRFEFLQNEFPEPKYIGVAWSPGGDKKGKQLYVAGAKILSYVTWNH